VLIKWCFNNIYERIYGYLLNVVILVHGYEQDIIFNSMYLFGLRDTYC